MAIMSCAASIITVNNIVHCSQIVYWTCDLFYAKLLILFSTSILFNPITLLFWSHTNRWKKKKQIKWIVRDYIVFLQWARQSRARTHLNIFIRITHAACLKWDIYSFSIKFTYVESCTFIYIFLAQNFRDVPLHGTHSIIYYYIIINN